MPLCRPSILRPREEVSRGMFEAEPSHSQGLVARYSFEPDKLVRDGDRQVRGHHGDLPRSACFQVANSCDRGCCSVNHSSPCPSLLRGPCCLPRLAQTRVKGDGPAGAANQLYLGADAPSWVYSTAPLAQPDGTPVAPPTPGAAGHAMFLTDQQVGVRKTGCACC